MDQSPRAQIDAYLPHLQGLILRGRQIRDALATDPSAPSAIAANRTWQQDCGVVVNQLSGGSKAHWLARSFSEAFLLRAAGGPVVESAPPSEIVDRLIGVLEQAMASLAGIGDHQASAATSAPAPRRFDFVHNAELRPVVEQAYSDSRRAYEQGRYGMALMTSCGVLESVVTDALEHKGSAVLAAAGAPVGDLADWTFEQRLALAERVGLIHSECVRLPAAARSYRDLAAADGSVDPNANVSERDARVTAQVLRIVIRDLDPGR